jgi:class 3 adenylate cyclase
MLFRIGIHVGEVLVESARIYGGGVNTAARLEGLANPGGICISGIVYEQVSGKVELEFVDAGDHTVRNIPTPVRVYRISM